MKFTRVFKETGMNKHRYGLATLLGLSLGLIVVALFTTGCGSRPTETAQPVVVQPAVEQASTSLTPNTPSQEPARLNFYASNNAFVARAIGVHGAKVIVRNHKGRTASAYFTPRKDSNRLMRWPGSFDNQDANVANPGELTTHPYTVFIERNGERIARFYLDPLKVTDAFGPSFYAHVHGDDDHYRPALTLNGVAEYDTGRKVNKH
ncbi:MAG TPA: hypothetical protein VGQ87_03195 [Patescibacteria group bacterium]|jgi:hypothetical protein|nr:hypothetical protein [Patescibacteria group bacterium]